jgi:NTP pyrophosphatase (non-canonical NTP hydrolase)
MGEAYQGGGERSAARPPQQPIQISEQAQRGIEYVRRVSRTEGLLSLRDMQQWVAEFCIAKGWSGEGSPEKTFGDCMALLHSEVSEALEAYRNWGMEDVTDRCGCGIDLADQATVGEIGHRCKPEGVGSEFADILVRLLDDCERWGIDLEYEFKRKMQYNDTRAYRHGGKKI